MGLMDRFKNRLANGDNANNDNNNSYDNDYYSGFENDFDENKDPQQPADQGAAAPLAQDQGAAAAMASAPSQTYGGMSLNGSAIELKVVKPDSFANVSQIADHLLNRRTVVLNLEATNKETARRLIDFLSGVAYSIDGEMRRVANNAYVITPNNVAISGDKLRIQKQAAAPVAPEPAPQQSGSEFFEDLNN